MKKAKFCNCKPILFMSSRHRNPSKVVHMLNQHGWSWDSVQWWHAMLISSLWLSHNMSRMKRQRTCFGILSWESFPSVSCRRADGGSCVNILLYSSSKSDFRLLSHERWYDFLGGLGVLIVRVYISVWSAALWSSTQGFFKPNANISKLTSAN